MGAVRLILLRSGGAFVKGLTGSLMDRGASGEELPAPHDDIDIGGVELETVAGARAHLGGDQAGSRAEKRVIDQLAGPAVVGDRPAHALDRLLRAVPPALRVLRVAKRIVVGDLPECRLRAVALPVGRLAVAHRIPAAFVLPMIMAAVQREVLLRPHDLGAALKPTGGEISPDHLTMQRAVPHISDISGKQRISLFPVGAVVIEDLAACEIAATLVARCSPRLGRTRPHKADR